MAYLLDSNVFIQASNLHYGFDFCPGFWEWLLAANAESNALSITQVQDELAAGDDQLAEWAKTAGRGFFLEIDQATSPTLARVAQWVQSQDYDAPAINTFLQVADYYLVSYALAHGHTIVTHEVPADSVRKIKIPNVCMGLGVSWMNPFSMLRREAVRLVLDQAA